MNQTESVSLNNSRKSIKDIPSYNLTEETLDFKPITEGLGFHKKADTPNKLSRTQQARNKQTPSVPMPEVTHPYLRNKTRVQSRASVENKKIEAVDETVQEAEIFEEASMFESGAAYLLDLVTLCASFIGLNLLFMKMLNVDFNTFKSTILGNDYLLVEGMLFSFMYVTFFTLLDCTKGFGKSLFNIELRTMENKMAGVGHTFFRSLVSLFSLPLLFLPLVLDFQGKISETKLIKSK